MVPSLGMSILGLIVGGLGGLAASAFGTQDSYAYTRNIVCLLLGGGAGAVAGAVVLVVAMPVAAPPLTAATAF